MVLRYTRTRPQLAQEQTIFEAPVVSVIILVYVWLYGLSYQTSKLGTIVEITGCVIVLIRAVVGLCMGAVPRNTLENVITALDQTPPAIFKALEAVQVAKVKFRMKNQKDADFKFTSK